MAQEYYSYLGNIILDVVYPRFLRNKHKHNPKLKEYVNSLPTITIENK
jgi:hypothetical protein